MPGDLPDKSLQEQTWKDVDCYISDRLVPRDPVLEAALAANFAAGLPAIDVSPNLGKFLHLLVRIAGARRVLEIGTLGGYSTIWLARALPSGSRLITLEANPKHAETARSNIARAGLSHLVEIRTGAAAGSLAQLYSEGSEPFDMIFIDADKPSNPIYLEWSLKLARPGTVIVTDNVVRDGAIADPQSADPSVQGTQRFFEMVAANPRLMATALQTVGAKGYDGFAVALVLDASG